ncbi:hypothetical protein OIE50_51200 [Streptomyces canus]
MGHRTSAGSQQPAAARPPGLSGLRLLDRSSRGGHTGEQLADASFRCSAARRLRRRVGRCGLDAALCRAGGFRDRPTPRGARRRLCARHRLGQRRPAAAGRQPAASAASAACRATRPGSPRYALRASRHSPLPRRGGPGLGGRRSSRPSRRRPAACPGPPPYGDFGDLKQQGQVSA